MVQKTIAIIGATELMGMAIAKKLASSSNHRLLLFGHDNEKASALVEDIKKQSPLAEIEWLSCLVDVGWEADYIISAVPAGAEQEIAEKIRDVATQKIVIIVEDADRSTGQFTKTRSAEEFQRLLPNSKIIKTFTTATAAEIMCAMAEADRYAQVRN